ncbi:MAG: RluA family pseudouridine synthase [Thermodesulfobacteriota bacterium]
MRNAVTHQAAPSPSNHPFIRRLATRIALPDQGCWLLDFLVRRFTYLDRAAWQADISAGRVLVNSVSATAEQTLSAGDLVEYQPPLLIEPEIATDYCVVHEDDDLLVLDKPAPLPCHPGGRYFRNTLWGLLREERRNEAFFFVNRLDRETSGLVLVAKNENAARHCARQFAKHEVDKEYLVVVEGEFSDKEVTATGWLTPDAASPVRKKMRFHSEQPPRDARHCTTIFSRREWSNGLSLLAARPRTGRCHQIRATLLALGFPVVGDKLYGVDETFFLRFIGNQLTGADWQRLRNPRQALHASRLTINHPATGGPLILTAPLPAELKNLLR